MTKEVYGFAILGSGVIAKQHALHLKKLGRARLVAVQSPQAEKAAAFASEFGCRSFTRLDDLLACDEVDIVTICTPSGLHAESAIACARAGKHVITEKPMEIMLEKADAMIAAFHSAKLHLGVIFQHRFDDAVQRVKSHLAAGRFGKIAIGTAAINMYRPQSYYDAGSWRGTWDRDGGGALMNQGIHTVDVLQYLMGPVESVQAVCRTLGHERIEVEDCAVATLHFQSGAIGTVVGTTCAYPGLNTRVEVFGTHGSAVIDNDQLRFCRYRDASGVDVNDVVGVPDLSARPLSEQGFTHQFADMMDAIDSGRPPFVDGREGRKSLEIILAIYASSRTGARVTIGG